MRWPNGFWNWWDLVTVALFACFLLDKARLMFLRSRYRDRLGWSLILNDAMVGLAYVFGVVVTLDPLRFYNSTEHKIVRVIVLSVVIWTWVVIRIARPNRIAKAVGGDE